MFDDTYEGEPEWNAENCNKRQGDTTFEMCGWCEHRGCGSCRYDCMLSGYCDLMKDYGDERNVKWDTPCKIKCLGPEDLKSIISSKKWKIESNEQYIVRLKKQIGVLDTLAENALYRPPLPGSRPHDYYNLGDGVWVFHENKWNHGTVVAGYRHHDGCVSYILEEYPDSKADKRGPWGCGCAVPGILKDVELQYFKENPEAFTIWCASCDRPYNGERAPLIEMQAALLSMN